MVKKWDGKEHKSPKLTPEEVRLREYGRDQLRKEKLALRLKDKQAKTKAKSARRRRR